MITEQDQTAETIVRQRSAWWNDQFNAGRVEAVAEVYAEDAALLIAGIPAVYGVAAIRDLCSLLVSSGVQDVMIQVEHVESSGNLAFLRGRYIMKASQPDQPERLDCGKLVQVWRNGSDGWRMVVDSVSPDGVPGL